METQDPGARPPTRAQTPAEGPASRAGTRANRGLDPGQAPQPPGPADQTPTRAPGTMPRTRARSRRHPRNCPAKPPEGCRRKLSHSTSERVAGPPAISVSDATVQEAEGAVLAFSLTLSHPSSRTVTVDYATQDGATGTGAIENGESSPRTQEDPPVVSPAGEFRNFLNMTRSARGTVSRPGKNIRAKTGLNRSILQQGWGRDGELLSLSSAALHHDHECIVSNARRGATSRQSLITRPREPGSGMSRSTPEAHLRPAASVESGTGNPGYPNQSSNAPVVATGPTQTSTPQST